jgi:hypothetical protein
MLPPEAAVNISLIMVSVRLNVLSNILEWRFKSGCISFVHANSKIHDPHTP